MPTTLVPGKKICEELGISVDDLAKWCQIGELIAYNENHQPILTPYQCKSKFKYPFNSIFNLELIGVEGIIAINRKTVQNFEIFIEDDNIKNHKKKILQNSRNHFTSSLIEESVKQADIRQKAIKELCINYKNDKYITFYDANYQNSIYSKKLLIPYKEGYREIYRIRLYELMFLRAYTEGIFDVDFIILPIESLADSFRDSSKKIIHQSLRINVEKIHDDFGEKLIIRPYNKQNIYVNIISNTYARLQPIIVSRRTFHSNEQYNFESSQAQLKQYSVDYFKENDLQRKTPIDFGTELFTFEYKDFCKQYFRANSEKELYQKYQEYINTFLYNTNTVNTFLKREIEIINIKRDPLEYMNKKCRELAGKYMDNDYDLETIKMYRDAIMPPKKTWKSIYNKFMSGQEAGGQEEAKVSKRLKLFKKLAEKNGIPYIDALKLRDMSQRTRPKIIEKMIGQLKPKTEDETDSNFESHSDK